MNHDDHQPDLSTLIDPELEARVVAWASGEASPFEAAELIRLTNEKPELAIFKRRIEAVRGLVAEAIRPDREPLLLSPERRTKLLRALGATESKPNPASNTNTVVLPLAAAKKKQRYVQRWIYGLAACLTVGLFTLMSIPSFQKSREANYKMLARPIASSEPREPAVHFDLPVAENVEHGAQADGQKRREIAYQYATSGAEMRKSEREAKEMDFSARDAAKQQKMLQVAKGKMEHEAQKAARSQQIALSSALAKAGTVSALPGQILAERNAGGGKKIADTTVSNEEQVVLSPFVVEAKGDTGYAAKDTLAGSRVRTELKDVSSAISVVTNQYLKDTGTHNSQDLLLYTANTEVGGLKGNFTTPQANAPLSPGGIESAGSDKEVDANSIDLPLAQEKPKTQKPAPVFSEVNATKEPVSTFSLHVSDVSFRLAQAALAKGDALDRASIRPEEFYNAFSYDDPTPALAEKVSCRIEQAAHPFVQQRNLVRIAVKVAASGRDAAQPLHLTVLLDTSGSMEREDRAATIQSAMKALTSLLGRNDRLTLIGFARQARLLAESLPGDQASQALNLIAHTPAEGGTNLEEALKLGGELAHRQFDPSAQNRIVLLTDGAANLGNANPAQLAASIEALRQQGIAFDACGVGLEGLDDGMLENLTRKGDGRYYVLNSPEAADAGFAKQLAGAFRPAAENVKLQVRFNPARVGNYRLIGFEQHRLREEDFRNDSVDAAELAAEEAAVAVYQVEALPQGEGELGEVYVRFHDPSSGNMVERNWTLNYDAQAPAFDRAAPSIQLAGTAALLAEKLQGGEAGNAINLGDLAPVVNKLRSHYANEPRVQELVTMFEQARKLAGE